MSKEVHVFATFFSASAFVSAVAVGVALPVLALQLEVAYRRNARKNARATEAPPIKEPARTADPAH
jgi:hypothetical protein